jgi:hypothetical protein
MMANKSFVDARAARQTVGLALRASTASWHRSSCRTSTTVCARPKRTRGSSSTRVASSVGEEGGQDEARLKN